MEQIVVKRIVLIIAIVVFTVLALIGGARKALSQETQLTYCQNGKGEVVIVSNFTCPPGYWPI
jgi:hypothetical protein